MASKRPQTMAKRARELAVKEKRERKRLKKAERAAGGGETLDVESDGLDLEPESPPSETTE